MHTRIALAVLAAAISATAAWAQTAPANPKTSNPATTITEPSSKVTGQWRSSKMIGVKIYNDHNQRLGEVSDIILDPAGKVTGYVVAVGGFLGVGRHDILVDPSKITFTNESVRAASTKGGSPMTTKEVSSTSHTERWYPNHGLLPATRDQLKAMPEFKYSTSN